jgi:hypothetical protein
MPMPLVFGVIAASIAPAVMLPLSFSQSTNTGVAPHSATACTVAAWVMAGTMTSSPGPTPTSSHARCRDAMHDDVDAA